MCGGSLGPDETRFDPLGIKIRVSAEGIHGDAAGDRNIERNDRVGHLRPIFAKNHIERPVQIVLDLPMAASDLEDVDGILMSDAGNKMPALRRGFVFDGALRFYADKR